jgi:hypothetical protein
VMNLVPHAVALPAAQIVIDRLPRRNRSARGADQAA